MAFALTPGGKACAIGASSMHTAIRASLQSLTTKPFGGLSSRLQSACHESADQTAKPPARFCGQRLCLVPHTRRFLGQQSLGVEQAVKCSWCGFFTFYPPLLCRYAKRGDGQSDRGRLRSAQRLFCVQNSASTEKKGPDVNAEAKGARLFWPTILGGGRTVITLLDAGGSEATVRRCRD